MFFIKPGCHAHGGTPIWECFRTGQRPIGKHGTWRRDQPRCRGCRIVLHCGKENSPRRRWFQFELRPLFLFTAVVAVGLWARPAADLLLLIGCFLVVVLGWAWLTVSVAHALADKLTGQSRTGRMRKCESPKTSPENGIPRTSVRPSTKDAWGC
jgi:hypothetical protein